MTNQHSNLRISILFAPLLLLALSTLWTKHAHAVELPPVTGAAYDGRQISWNAQAGAAGYNVYRDFFYHDTVVGVTSYVPELTGRYFIAAFDNDGQYSPWLVRNNPDNVVQVDELMSGVDAPANVTGTVYSATAGEVFWDRLFSRSLTYRIFLDGALVGSTRGSSFFLNSLSPDAINRVSIVAETEAALQSDQVVLEFNTLAGPFPTDASLSGSTVLALRPDSPQNASITLYSRDTAELFWERPPLSDNIIATDIFRDGELIGTTNGISFFDADGVFSFNQRVDSRHKYELVAINSNGERSLPAVINPGAFDGSKPEVLQRLLTGVTDVTTNNAHVQWFAFLQNIAFGNVDDFAEQVSVENIVEDDIFVSSLTEYSCFNGGSLTIASAPTAFINTTLSFNLCSIDGGEIDGVFSLNGLDAGGYTVTYDNLGIDMVDTMFGLDGIVELTVGRAFGNTTLSYQDFRYSTFSELFDEEDFFAVEEVFTTDSANYTSGELILESVNEADSLVLSANTGDADSWSATITDNTIEGVVVETLTGTWDENVRLPCVSAFAEDVAASGCAFR